MILYVSPVDIVLIFDTVMGNGNISNVSWNNVGEISWDLVGHFEWCYVISENIYKIFNKHMNFEENVSFSHRCVCGWLGTYRYYDICRYNDGNDRDS